MSHPAFLTIIDPSYIEYAIVSDLSKCYYQLLILSRMLQDMLRISTDLGTLFIVEFVLQPSTLPKSSEPLDLCGKPAPKTKTNVGYCIVPGTCRVY